jgi:heat shock protein HslJ
MWVVSDNLRAGAALSAVKVAEVLVNRQLIQPKRRAAGQEAHVSPQSSGCSRCREGCRGKPEIEAMLAKSFAQILIRAAALVVLAGTLSAVSASAADASLAGTHWRLLSVGSMDADASRREPFIVLDANGQIAGGTGCNRFSGGYVTDGEYLTIGQVATTRMYCASVWEQERAILDTLPLVTRWQVNGDKLELIGGTGVVLAVFEAETGVN